MTDPNPIAPWYKQPWLWFILAPLIATFMYSTVYISAAVFTRDTLVRDNYYKEAKEIKQDNSKIKHAASLGITATLSVDTLTGDVSVQLKSDDNSIQPKALTLDFAHATLAERDIAITLRQVRDGIYLGSLTNKPLGKQYIILQPQMADNAEAEWEIRQTIYPPYDQNQFELIPLKSN